jgi:hypothetical protein
VFIPAPAELNNIQCLCLFGKISGSDVIVFIFQQHLHTNIQCVTFFLSFPMVGYPALFAPVDGALPFPTPLTTNQLSRLEDKWQDPAAFNSA